MGSFARCFCRRNVPSEESPTRSLIERRAKASGLHLLPLTSAADAVQTLCLNQPSTSGRIPQRAFEVPCGLGLVLRAQDLNDALVTPARRGKRRMRGANPSSATVSATAHGDRCDGPGGYPNRRLYPDRAVGPTRPRSLPMMLNRSVA
jgi:hypothetical protein